jgi:hypothetical protein
LAPPGCWLPKAFCRSSVAVVDEAVTMLGTR